MSDWKTKDDQCFIETHFSFTSNTQPCDGREMTYFEDFTKNHNKALIEIEIENAAPGCMVTAIVETRDGKTIERPIPLFEGEGELAIQVENLCSVTLRGVSHNNHLGAASAPPNGYPPVSTFEADVGIDKTFCICCPGENHDHHSCNRCGSSDRCRCARNSYRNDYY